MSTPPTRVERITIAQREFDAALASWKEAVTEAEQFESDRKAAEAPYLEPLRQARHREKHMHEKLTQALQRLHAQ